MKKIIVSALLISLLAGCGEPWVLTVDGVSKEYPTYGFLNASTQKSEKVCYEVSIGNVIWTIIGIENIVMPVGIFS